MMKRILAGAAATGFAVTLFAGGSVQAAGCTPDEAPNADGPVLVELPGTGSTIYGEQTGDTGGYIGITGDNGWLEAGGDESGGTVAGRESGGNLEGELVVSDSPSLCVNGEDVL